MLAFHNSTRRPLAATIAAILLGAVGTQAARAEETKAASSASGLEEIVVTASKREELLINVPVAITALGSSTLENLGVSSFNDYVGLVPGLSQRSGGAPGSGTVIIRGLNSGPQQLTSTTGFYLDDAPFTPSGSLAVGALVLPDADLTDVERIEVLKGPQGTLYGASSLGGLVRIISKRPDLTHFSGNVGLSGTNVDNGSSGYGARGTLNMPLIADRVGLRLSGFYRSDPGFTTNVGTGHVDVNDAKIDGGRLSLLAKFNDDVDLLITGLYQKTQSDGPSTQDNRTDTLVPIYGERKFSAYFDPTFDLTIKTIAGTLNWKAGPGTLTAILAHNQYDSAATADYTASYLPLLARFLPPGSGIKAIPQPSSKKFSAEVRYASDRIGNWEFLGGGFYTDEDNLYRVSLNGEFKANQAPLPGILHNLLDSVTNSTYKETAVFANASYYFSDSIDLTIGGRYAKNKQNVDITRTGLLLGFFTPHTATFNLDDDATTYLATLRWRLSDSVSTFLRASSGYRPGGPQTSLNAPDTTPFGSDTVWNYEAGVKAALLDGRMNLSSSIYHIDWKDMQLATLNGGFILTGNAGAGTVNGLEFDLQYSPITSVTLGMNMGYTDTKITSISPGASATLGAVEGDAFPLTSKYTGAATADYRMPISEGTNASFGLTCKYQGERPSSFSAAALNPNIDLPAYTTLDLRIGLERGPYRVQLRADNMTDETGITTSTTSKLFPGQPVPSVAALIRPRSYTLSFTADF